MSILTALALGFACECVQQAPVPTPQKLVENFSHPEDTPESAALSAPPTREGNTAQLLINGEAAFGSRMELLESAKESIFVQVLIWKGDTTGRALGDALIAKKKANPEIDIRVIVDAYANIQDVKAQLLFFDLQNAGIEVEGFEAFYLHWLNEIDFGDWVAGNKRYHEKYWIVDGERAVVGGMNIADEYARCTDDPTLIWRDQDVLLEGPVVADIDAAFRDNFAQFKAVKATKGDLMNPDTYWNLWREKNMGLLKVVEESMKLQRKVFDHLPWAHEDQPCNGAPVSAAVWEDVTVRFLRNRPRMDERHIPDLYVERIDAATENVIVQNAYFVPTDDLQAALVRAAQRGVEVTVITNSMETNDIPMITIAGRARYLELIDAGVAVYEWHAQRFGEGTVHSKLATFDDTSAIIGSYNLDPRSVGLNSEDVVVLEHPGSAAELADWVRDRDLPMAERVTREQAVEWTDLALLPDLPKVVLPPWLDPLYDAQAFEYFLLRQIEGSL